MLLKWSSYRLIMSSTVFPDFIPLWLGASFFFNPAHPNRFEPNEVEQTLFSLFLWRDSWNNHLVKCQHQSSISSLLWPDPQVQNKWAASPGFYEFNKCVQHFTIENKGKICVTAAASTHRGNAYFFLLKERKRHKMKILKFRRFNQV